MTPEERDARAAALLARTKQIIAEHGWSIQAIMPTLDDPGVSFAYTVGLSGPKLGHPELVIVGLHVKVAQRILNQLADRVAAGERLHAGQHLQATSPDVPLELVQADAGDRRAPLSVANRLYGLTGPVEALQIVYPDSAGKFPWDQGVEPGLAAVQFLLGARSIRA